jgi:hypothetical protein
MLADVLASKALQSLPLQVLQADPSQANSNGLALNDGGNDLFLRLAETCSLCQSKKVFRIVIVVDAGSSLT